MTQQAATAVMQQPATAKPLPRVERLGDFRTTIHVVPIAALAVGLGVISSFLALILLSLIGLFTNLFYAHRISFELLSPASTNPGLAGVLVPVAGGLIIGLMARFGSERIRGHGIPEAIEAILINRSKVQPRVALLKPLSSAISIGSGGPFGAEGPIILTGGAFGSLVGQLFHLTSVERKTLLVAGAAAGMSATFDAPIASALLAVELLLFEWKPRSLIPIALASATAAFVRQFLLGNGPLFPTPPHATSLGPDAFLSCVVAGIAAGGLSCALTAAVYGAEDAFHRLPIHWMWWPAIGGLAIGLGGLLFPQALGVGYDTIGGLLQGQVAGGVIAGVLIVKSLIWAISLGSGTSGGVLAPLLMMGGALGGLEAMVMPNEGAGFWPLISMAATLGGTMRSPFTAIVFAVELTHNIQDLLPLLIAVTFAYGLTVLVMRRSILTEKVSRRGHHLSREYSLDPLELMFVRQVMQSDVQALPETLSVREASSLTEHRTPANQTSLPIVDDDGAVVSVTTRREIRRLTRQPESTDLTLADLTDRPPTVAHPDEPLSAIAHRMAGSNETALPVVESGSGRLLGVIALPHLLEARRRNLEEERHRERSLHVRLPAIRRSRNGASATADEAHAATLTSEREVQDWS
jgi:H+/Cl- antiporter ClcA/CBS domain-containing protein